MPACKELGVSMRVTGKHGERRGLQLELEQGVPGSKAKELRSGVTSREAADALAVPCMVQEGATGLSIVGRRCSGEETDARSSMKGACCREPCKDPQRNILD
jgi:hypothetical protein